MDTPNRISPCPLCKLSMHWGAVAGVVEHYYGDGTCPLFGKEFSASLWENYQPKSPQPSAPVQPGIIEAQALHDAYASPSAQPQPEEAAIQAAAEEIIREMYVADGVGFERGRKDEEFDVEADIAACAGFIRKHLKSAPEPSVAAEACKHPAETAHSIHFGREGLAHWCQACGSLKLGEYSEWIAPAAHPGIVPGWMMVPVEPTKEMYSAARWSGNHDCNIREEWVLREIYSRMLAAAPKVPK